MLNNKRILLTGGTGSFGKAFVKTILSQYPNVERLVIFSRDELKQYEMAQEFSQKEYPALRYFIGDVRDAERLRRACQGIDTIIHAAALKHVSIAEYNPIEFINTNVIGAENVISAALDNDVKNVVALSTDKAAAPINLYGATKLCSDKLFVAANNITGKRDLKFSVVRYGNVLGSRGSVVPFFLKKRSEGTLPITHKDMTRFNITLEDGVALVLKALKTMEGGEVFVPKLPSYKIGEMAKAISPDAKIEYIGIRPGEKIHEEMITSSDSLNTVEFDDHYVICPSSYFNIEDYVKRNGGKRVEEGFAYSSGNNTDWLTAEEIRTQIREHVDPEFKV
jgi:UDP-N-acetylglucosamine 4,6-dehydratase (inverting)